MRRKQYDYYRQFLLCLDNNLPSASIKERHAEISWRTLGEISRSISSGRAKTKDKIGMYPVYGSTGMIARTNKAVYKKKNILVARVGSAGYVYIAEGEYDVSDNTLIIDLKDRYNLKYIYYQLVNIDLRRYAKGGVQPLITGGEIKRITLPFPSEEEQARIVSILDRFDALVGDPTSGLPAEIEARRKQYEYYRNKLLDFNRGGAPPWTTLKSDRRSASCEKRSISPSSSLQRR
ncbi:MAG: hypothetical protein HFG26_09860 [Provencibacterium sp.]|nr:hypothetical protein [Provencibacterium sp.]